MKEIFVLFHKMQYLCRRIGNDLTTPKIRKKMKPSKKLVEKILTDNDFSLDLAKAMKDTTQYAIITRAKRYSKLLLLAPFVEVYKAYGLSEEDIYAKEEENDSGDCTDRVQGA